MNSEIKTCQNCKNSFIIEPDDFGFYERMKVPPPTFCPECRFKRRYFYRNFRTLYNRVSSKSGNPIISMYHKDQPFPVYSNEEWYQDGWDAIEYGRDFDFSRPFFEQYKALADVVPRAGLLVNNSPDCGYSNLCNRSSHCYFSFGCVDSEFCDYNHSVWNCRESLDSLYIFKSEFCYECINVKESNQLFYCEECEGCADSIGLFDCRGCTDCIGCVGLRNKSHYIFNQPVSKEEYKKFKETYPLSKQESIEFILKKRNEVLGTFPVPETFGSNNVHSTGNHLYNCKNVKYAFNIRGGEDSKFGVVVRKMVNSYDMTFSLDVENCYESMFSDPYDLQFCHLCVSCTSARYSQFCFNSNNIFGCTGLRKKDYCILNKQYSKEEYEVLVPKIIEHMKKTGEYGEFFPIKDSPYAYNESTVSEYCPLDREQAIAQGYVWKDNIPFTQGQENMKVSEVTEEEKYNFEIIKNKIFACDTCSRNYRLIDHELSFYARFKLALPTKCFFCRHDARMRRHTERVLYHRNCAKCAKEIQTTYSPERPEIVYCEKCYQAEVY